MAKVKEPHSEVAWAYSNLGLTIGVAWTKRKAIRCVTDMTGKTWRESKTYMEVWKCKVVPL